MQKEKNYSITTGFSTELSLTSIGSLTRDIIPRYSFKVWQKLLQLSKSRHPGRPSDSRRGNASPQLNVVFSLRDYSLYQLR
jgi:hypothetical protein